MLANTITRCLEYHFSCYIFFIEISLNSYASVNNAFIRTYYGLSPIGRQAIIWIISG